MTMIEKNTITEDEAQAHTLLRRTAGGKGCRRPVNWAEREKAMDDLGIQFQEAWDRLTEIQQRALVLSLRLTVCAGEALEEAEKEAQT